MALHLQPKGSCHFPLGARPSAFLRPHAFLEVVVRLGSGSTRPSDVSDGRREPNRAGRGSRAPVRGNPLGLILRRNGDRPSRV
jgi:hypothetical protein